MVNLTQYPIQDAFQTTLAQAWNGGVGTMFVNAVPTGVTIPSGVTTYLVVDPGKSTQQVCEIDSFDNTAKTFNVTNVTLEKGIGLSYSAVTHAVGAKVIISDNFEFWKKIVAAINSKADSGGNTNFTGDIIFSGSVDVTGKLKLPVVADTTARDVLYPAPVDGNIVDVLSLNAIQFYSQSLATWLTLDVGTPVPNASTSTPGIVRVATTINDADSASGVFNMPTLSMVRTYVNTTTSTVSNFGDGSDGALNVTSGTTTLSLNKTYNFTSINVSVGATLAFSQSGIARPAMLNCQGNCTIAGTVELRGVIDTQLDYFNGNIKEFLRSGTAKTANTITAGEGGLGGDQQGGSAGNQVGGNGGDGGQAGGTGLGGVGGAVGNPGTNGQNNPSGGGGGGGGGGATSVGSGSNGSNSSGNNGGNGGNGGTSTTFASGGGGGGGGGFDTGNGGNGGNGGIGIDNVTDTRGGRGGAGGNAGANGGTGGDGGENSSSGGGGVAGGGKGGDSIMGNAGNGGDAVLGQNSSDGGCYAGDGGNSIIGNGGNGGNNAANGFGGNGGEGRNGGNGGSDAITGTGGDGGDAKTGAVAFCVVIGGDLTFTGTINGQGGNGGNGGNGGVGITSVGGDGGDGADGADVLLLALGTITNSGTINNTGGTGGALGTAPSINGSAGIDGKDGKKFVAKIYS